MRRASSPPLGVLRAAVAVLLATLPSACSGPRAREPAGGGERIAAAASAPAERISLDGSLVFSDSGHPVAGAEVRLEPRPPIDRRRGRELPPMHALVATSDAAGRFAFPRVPANRTYSLRVRGPELPLFEPIDVVATGSAPRHLPPLQVPPAVPIEGYVRDEGAVAIAGASVRLLVFRAPLEGGGHFSGPPGEWVTVLESVTDGAGRFTLHRAVVEPWGVVAAESAEHAPTFEAISPATDGALDLRLERAAVIDGTVVTDDGDPASGVEVIALPRLAGAKEWSELAARRAVSDAAGRFRITGASPGAVYNVFTDGARRGFVWRTGATGRSASRIVVRGRRIASAEELPDEEDAIFGGSVLDAATRRPIEGAQVIVWYPMSSVHVAAGAATDAAGRFRLRLPDSGDWIVAVRAPGHAPRFDSIFGGRDEGDELAVSPLDKEYLLERITPARVLVRRPDGTPVPHLPVVAWVGGSDLEPAYSRGITDASGLGILAEARIEDLEEIWIHSNGHRLGERLRRVAIVGGAAVFDLPAASLEGEVVDESGAPLAGALVGEGRYSCRFTDGAGRFSLGPGPELSERQEPRISARGKKRFVLSFETPRAAAEPLRCILEDDPGGRVRLVDDSGRPLAGVVGEGEVTGEDGRMLVPWGGWLEIDLPGHERLSWSRDDEGAGDRGGGSDGGPRFVLRRTGRIELEIGVERIRRIANAAGRFDVEAIDGASPPRRFRLGAGLDLGLRPDGVAVVDRLPPGRYTLRIFAAAPYAPLELRGIDARPLAETRIRDVPLAEGARLAVDLQTLVESRRGDPFVRCRCVFQWDGGDPGGGRSEISGEPTESGCRFIGLPAGDGELEIAIPGGFYPLRLGISGLELGVEKRVTADLERFPELAGRVVFPERAGAADGLSLRFQPIDDWRSRDVTDVQGVEEMQTALAADGSFRIRLHDGRYRVELWESGAPAGTEAGSGVARGVQMQERKRVRVRVRVRLLPSSTFRRHRSRVRRAGA